MRTGLAIGLTLLLCGCAGVSRAAEKEVDRLQNAAEVISEITHTPERGIPRDLMDRSVCVGIIPSEMKGAFIFGATYGRGVMVCRRDGSGPWGAPSMFMVGGANFGFQIGGEETDFVLLVMNGRGAERLLHDNTKFGADASAAAGPVGRSAEGATDLQLHAEILTYSRARGAFAGVSLDGQMFKQDGDSNERLYGHRISPVDILFKGVVPVPASAQPLVAALTQFSPHGGESFHPR
jgi:SH3 domain-containing YSC84-like protein 1